MRPFLHLFLFVLAVFQGNYLCAHKNINFLDPDIFNTDLQDFRKNMKIFVSNKGEIISYTEDFANYGTDSQKYLENNFFFGDPNTLWQLEVLSTHRRNNGDINLSEINMTFLDQRYPEGGFIIIKNKKLFVRCGTKTKEYELADNSILSLVQNHAEFMPLPSEARELLALFKFKDSKKYIYLDRSKYNTPEYRLYIGDPGSMILNKIKSVFKKDEAAANKYFTHNDGLLVIPKYHSSRKPTYNGQELIDVESSMNLNLLGVQVAEDPQLTTPCGAL